jgi:predicted RecA/RadA family phage recombinase
MRKPKTIALHIPQPCHENWDSMSPTQQGRYCQSCEKEVVSFANQSDAQIVEFFKSSPKKVCGQFRPEQLRTYTLPQQSLVGPRLRAITVGSLLSVITATAVYGQQGKNEQHGQDQQIFELPVTDAERQYLGNVVTTKADTTHSVLGQITDLNSGKLLSGTTIQIKRTRVQTHADSDGRFSLAIPKRYRGKAFTVFISKPGYETQERTIIPDQLPTTLRVQLLAEPPREIYETKGDVQMIMGKVVAPRN